MEAGGEGVANQKILTEVADSAQCRKIGLGVKIRL